MIGGAWLHERRGRTEAALAMVGTGTAGLLATLVVASEVYGLISPLAEVAGSLIVGAAATVLAIRWAGRAIGGLGLVGGLLSPLLVGAPSGGATVVVLLRGHGGGDRGRRSGDGGRGWRWRRCSPAPQWSLWLLAGHSRLTDVLALTAFAFLGLGGAIATQRRSARERPAPAAVALLTLNAAIAAIVGTVVLDAAGASSLVAALWLGALAGAHALPAGTPPSAGDPRFAELSGAIAVTLADVAFGLTAHGTVLVLGWAAAAIGCAWLARRREALPGGSQVAHVGLAAHLGLVLVRVAVIAPPSELGAGARAPRRCWRSPRWRGPCWRAPG